MVLTRKLPILFRSARHHRHRSNRRANASVDLRFLQRSELARSGVPTSHSLGYNESQFRILGPVVEKLRMGPITEEASSSDSTDPLSTGGQWGSAPDPISEKKIGKIEEKIGKDSFINCEENTLFLSSVNRSVGIHGQPWPEVSRPVRPQRAGQFESPEPPARGSPRDLATWHRCR